MSPYRYYDTTVLLRSWVPLLAHIFFPSSLLSCPLFSILHPLMFLFQFSLVVLLLSLLFLSPSCAFLILSFRFPSFTIISTLLIYSGFTNFWSSLSLSTPFCQSGLLLGLSTFPMLFPGTCFNPKLNYDRYRAHFACLQFNFWLVIKYWRFLWSVQISNSSLPPPSSVSILLST